MNYSPSLESPADILIVDDCPDNLKLLGTILRSRNYKVRCAISGEVALKAVKAAPPDLILLDINMPDLDGYQVCQQLKSDPLTDYIPVIFISALDTPFDKVKAFESGGSDYITKPLAMAEVMARINNQIKLKHSQEALKSLNLQLEQLNSQLEQRVFKRTNQLQAEIMERRKAQDKLLHLAMHDPLTNLPNRTWLTQYLEKLLEEDLSNNQFILILLNCDNFKVVNDSLGYFLGDRILVGVAQRLQQILPPKISLCRLEGDQFILILEKETRFKNAIAIIETLQQKFNSPFLLDQRQIFLNFTAGILLVTDGYTQSEQLLRDVRLAMYEAKKRGKCQYRVFDVQMHQEASERLQLAIEIRQAINNQEFVLYYQPLISLKSDRLIGFEALVRWNHPQHGLISPDKFIPVAEETDTIIPLGMWILKEACTQLVFWKNTLSYLITNENPDVSLSIGVNISVRQLSQPNLDEQIEEVIQLTGVERESIKLEITESILMDKVAFSQEIIHKIKARNIQLVLDDFGTGYSSLKYLHTLPIDTLKIDRSFITEIAETNKNFKIVKATIDLAHTLDIKVVAEGIETPEQVSLLKKLGCDYGQGYLFAKPLNAKAATELIQMLA